MVEWHRVSWSAEWGLESGWVGAALEAGPLPALFYFALSFEDTLLSDPYNTPVTIAHSWLSSKRVRIFSVTLPHHRKGQNEQRTVEKWLEWAQQTPFLWHDYFERLAKLIESLTPWIVTSAFCGLSRGAWIACQLVSHLNCFSAPLLLFAPMTQLHDGFLSADPMPPSLAQWSLQKLPLSNPLWISVGSCDRRIGTEHVIDWISNLCSSSRKSCSHLLIHPSIGYQGHGTPYSVFKEGIEWLERHWLQ